MKLKKDNNTKQELIVILIIIMSIAFFEASAPFLSTQFLREFVLNVLIYAAASIVVLILVTPFFRAKEMSSIASHVQNQQDEKQGRKEKILAMMREKGSVTNNDVETALSVSDASATNYLQELEREGKIKQIGERGRFVSYRLKK